MTSGRPARGSHLPGTYWWHNNWDFNAAGVAFEQLTGAGIFEAFGRTIAEPIAMQDYREDGFYFYQRDKSLHPAYIFRMSTRDLARFGLLFARAGRWSGRQVIPQSWVKEEPVAELANDFNRQPIGGGRSETHRAPSAASG